MILDRSSLRSLASGVTLTARLHQKLLYIKCMQSAASKMLLGNVLCTRVSQGCPCRKRRGRLR